MSQADELLESLSIEAQLADESTEEHITIGPDRIIEVPVSLRNIAVQHDHNIETVTFDCPRYWDGYDLSMMKIYINYLRADGVKGSYVAFNVVVDENDENLIHFNWTISRNVTLVKGTLVFLVCAKEVEIDGTEVLHWNTERNSQMTVSEGLEVTEEITEQYPDVLTQLLKRMGQLDGEGAHVLWNLEDGDGIGSLRQVYGEDPQNSNQCVAMGEQSVALGEGTITESMENGQTALGRYNVESSGMAVVVGNGTDDDNRSNAYTLDWEGNAEFAGNIKSKNLTVNDDGSIEAYHVGIDEDGNMSITGNIMSKDLKVDAEGNLKITGKYYSGNDAEIETSKIGDVKISTRDMDDPNWLLCDDTAIHEKDYPELFKLVSNPDDNIFFKEWKLADVPSEYATAISGIDPIYSADGYLYFITDDATTATRCKPDFTEFETYTLSHTGEFKYFPEVGYWTVSTSAKSIYCSRDCFHDATTVNRIVFATGTFPENKSDILKLTDLSYGNNKWYVCVHTLENDGDDMDNCVVCSAESLTDGFIYVDPRTEFNTPDKDNNGNTYTDLACAVRIASNGVYIALGRKVTASSTRYNVLYSPISTNNWTFTGINISDGTEYRHYSDINQLVTVNNKYIIKDGDIIRDLSDYWTSPGSPAIRSVVQYEGYYYARMLLGGNPKVIIRIPAETVATAEYESSPVYTTNVVGLFASDTHLYIRLDDGSIRYIDGTAQTVIPAALPGTIFKTYIKCK